MPKRNPSGPFRNRRGASRSDSDKPSSERKYSRGKPRRTKSYGKPSGEGSSERRGSFRKEDARGQGTKFSKRGPGPFKKFDKKEGSGRGEKPAYGKSPRPFSGEGKRPFKKFGGKKSFGKPFVRRGDEAPEGREGSYRKGGSSFSKDSSGKPPFRKFEKKPYTERPRREEGSPEEKSDRRESLYRRGGSSFSKDSSGKPPFRKFEKKPYSKRPRREEGPSEEKRGFFNKQSRSKPERPSRPDSYRDQEKESVAPTSDKIRLNKFISNSGVCSRREADNLIAMGLISVNGTVITEMGYKVNPGDEVRYESKVLRAEKPVYILMNKPKGFLTTTKDPQERNTVMHIIANSVKERVYPVGRLDRNTTGLLLLTNDGDLADKLSHPSYNVKKIYKVELDRPLTKNDFQKITEGVKLEEGRAMVDDLAIVSDDGKTVGLELHIGWNRVVRRIFEALQYEVVKLDRSVYAGLDKKDLPRGEWRFLKKEEVIHLKHFK